ncbi:MAG: DNA polymerase III subunit gamma/tau domain-containing protein, partial [Pirellulales bacterium]
TQPTAAPADGSAPATPAAPAGGETAVPAGATPAAQPVAGEAPKRPADVTKWKTQDYLAAKVENDPKLIDAVTDLGRRSAGKSGGGGLFSRLVGKFGSEDISDAEGAANLLAKLLVYQPPKPAPDAGATPGPGETANPAGSAPAVFRPGYSRPSPSGGADNQSPPDVRLVEAIISALGLNGSPTAVKTLTQLLAGAIPTGVEDKAVVDATLKTLAANARPEYEKLLLAALITPTQFRSAAATAPPAGTAQPGGIAQPGGAAQPGGIAQPGGAAESQPSGPAKVSAGELQQQAFTLVSPTASPQLRLTLARHAIDPQTPRAHRDLFWPLIEQQNLANVGAHVALYLDARTDAKLKEALQGYFLNYSSTALGGLLGVPQAAGTDAGAAVAGPAYGTPGGVAMSHGPVSRPSYSAPPPATFDAGGTPGSLPRPDAPAEAAPETPVEGAPVAVKSDPELALLLARQIWDPRVVAVVEKQLAQVTTLEKSPEVVVLASTFPLESTRGKLARLIQRRAKDNPQPLLTAGLLSKATSDPGLLVAVKSVPRKDTSTPASTSGRTSRRESDARGGAAATSQNESPQQWMKLSEDLVRALCRQFQAAAQGRPAAPAAASVAGETLGGSAKSPGAWPFKVRPGAKIVAEYQLNWPGDIQSKLPGIKIDPLVVHYVRMEQEERFGVLRGYYSRQVKSPATHTIENGVWFDSMSTGSEPTRKRSLDILITRVGQQTPPTTTATTDRAKEKEEAEPLILEFLLVEVPKLDTEIKPVRNLNEP